MLLLCLNFTLCLGCQRSVTDPPSLQSLAQSCFPLANLSQSCFYN